MKIISLSEIEVQRRQRQNIAPGPLNDLKESILGRGLLHPPVCWFDQEKAKWVLVTGERRFRAITEISNEAKAFYHGETEIPVGSIPITPLGDYLNSVGRFEAELDENVQRVDLEWPDRMRAYAALHTLRQLQNPGQTVRDTAIELADKAGFSLASDAKNAGTSKSAERVIAQAVVISQHLDNSKIANARNPAEALQLIYKQEEEKVLAALIRRQIAAVPTKNPIEIRHGDLFKILPQLDSNVFDLIIADPPYGIEASGSGFRARSVHHHNYKDDAESARNIATIVLTEGFRITKQRANIFIFCDIDLFPWLKSTASNMGWTVFRRPLIWMKSESEGLAPWGGQGPRITTEFIFYATKGQRGLNASPIDVFDDRRVNRATRLHAAEKPVSLFKSLISCSTLPGDYILDPCCGSGASLVAASELNRRGLGIEIDDDYFNTALANVFGKNLPKQVTSHDPTANIRR
jgi:DNA modification methylase/ParB-like chromosome segregation protein Spo0J